MGEKNLVTAIGKNADLDRRKELQNCAFVKTILMLLVVLDHSCAFWTGNWFTKDPLFSAGILSLLSKWLNGVHVYGFVLVSGYIFYYVKNEKGGYSRYFPFLKNKAIRLLVPYVFTAVLWVIPISCLFISAEPLTIVKNYLLAMNPGQLWFLIMLFVVFAIFWLLSEFFAKHDLLSLAVVLGVYACGLVGSSVFPNVFMIWTALRYMPLFWLGFKLRQHGSTVVRKIPGLVWVAASVLLFVLLRYLEGFDSVVFKLLKIGFTFFSHVVGALMAFVVLQSIADKVKWNKPSFAFVSKRSMTVYLFHQQIIYFCIYWLNGAVNPYVHAAINFAVSMGLSLVIASLLMKFCVTRFLIGEK